MCVWRGVGDFNTCLPRPTLRDDARSFDVLSFDKREVAYLAETACRVYSSI